MRQRISADPLGDLHLPARNQRARDGRAEEVLATVNRPGAQHRENEVLDEFVAQVLDVTLVGARRDGLGLHPIELLALANVGGNADDPGSRVMLLEPGNNDRGIETPRIGEDNGLHANGAPMRGVGGYSGTPQFYAVLNRRSSRAPRGISARFGRARRAKERRPHHSQSVDRPARSLSRRVTRSRPCEERQTIRIVFSPPIVPITSDQPLASIASATG